MLLFTTIFSRAKRIARGVERSSKPEVHKEEEDLDLISKLPDEILQLFMRWLSMQEAARTSVLSRRWKNVWMDTIRNTHSLSFVEMKYDMVFEPPGDRVTYDFVARVNKLMTFHQPPSLEAFTIVFPLNSYYSNDINNWVGFAARKGVKELYLDFGIDIEPLYDAASAFAKFPMYLLRDLCLRGVNVSDKVIEGLFSTSPFLESLTVCNSDLVQKLEIASSKLKCLDIRLCKNLEHLEISAPNLHRFKLCTNNGTDPIHLNITAPHLSLVTLCFLSAYKVDCFMGLLAYFSQFDRLELDLSYQALFHILYCQQPKFSKVEQLKILTYPWMKMPVPCSWSFLEAAPLLRSLSFEISGAEYSTTNSDVDFKWIDEDIPNKVKANVRHWHQNLKEVELVGFSGRRDEVELVFNLLEIAVSLEKIIIRVYHPPKCLKNRDIFEKLNQYAKTSRQFVQLFKTQIRPQISLVIV